MQGFNSLSPFYWRFFILIFKLFGKKWQKPGHQQKEFIPSVMMSHCCTCCNVSALSDWLRPDVSVICSRMVLIVQIVWVTDGKWHCFSEFIMRQSKTSGDLLWWLSACSLQVVQLAAPTHDSSKTKLAYNNLTTFGGWSWSLTLVIFLLCAFFFPLPYTPPPTYSQNGLQMLPPLRPSQFTSPLSSASGWVLIHANARVAAHPLQSARYLSSSLC